MYGYRDQPYEDEWGLHPVLHQNFVYPRYPPRYPVYRRYDHHPGYYPPGHVQMYGHRYFYDEFRSNSAHLPLPPRTEYAWSRPARRTQSSAHTRPRQGLSQFQANQTRIEPISSSTNHTSFASRFFGDSPKHEKKGRKRSNDAEKSNKVIIEPDILDKHSLVSQLVVNRNSYSSRESLASPKTSLTSLGARRSSPDEFYHSSLGTRRLSPDELYRSSLGAQRSSPDEVYRSSLGAQRSSPKNNYRVISDLLPSSTQQIHQVILEAGRQEVALGAGRQEVVLDVLQLQDKLRGQHHHHRRTSSSSNNNNNNNNNNSLELQLRRTSKTSNKSEGSCTCYQCHSSRKSSNSMVQDENCNLIKPVSELGVYPSVKSTISARRHLQRSATSARLSARLLTQAELLKLNQFRRFLRGSRLSQLDFLVRVEGVRSERDQEAGQEVDEDGNPYNNNRSSKDDSDQEFVALAAMLLCGELEIKPDTFQAITNRQQVREKLFCLVSADTDVVVTADQLIDRVASARRSQPKSELAGDNLRWLENVFKRTVGDHGEITLTDFKEIVQSKNPFFVERVFHIFDKDESGSISFQEFLDAMHQFAGQTPDDKIKFLFKVYDIDGDGLVQEAELQHVMRACMDENGMKFDEESIEQLTGALYQDATSNSESGITFSNLKSQISKHAGLLENLTISIDRWLVPPKPKKREIFKNFFNIFPHNFSSTYIRNNAPLIFFYIIFVLVNFGLLTSRLVGYRNSRNVDGSRNWALMIARATGQCLNFCCTFVLVPMLRLSVTKLREKGFNYLLPLDKHVSFHALTGKLIGIYSVIHTAAHLVNLGVNILVDPVGFLVLNHVPIPPHWSSDVNATFLPPPSLTDNSSLLPPPFLPPAAHANSSYSAPELLENISFSIPESYSVWSWLLTSAPGLFGLVAGSALPTGMALVLVLAVMIVCSMKWVRKSGNFEIFYWTHFLYLLFWLLVILHAPNFWKWFIGPFCLFVIEKCIRLYNSLSDQGKSYVKTGVVLPSKVVNLVIKRPPNFTFKPGDYIFLNIPSIAYFEWHPFTISSAPEQKDTISLHIRAVGHWTNSLYQYFEKEQARLEGIESPQTKRSKLRDTLYTAREKARRMSTSLAGSNPAYPPPRASALNVLGGGARRFSKTRGSNCNLHAAADMRKKSGGQHHNNHLIKRTETTNNFVGSDETEDATKMVARSFRYMRRKPTIIAYQPPRGSIDEREEDDLCSSNHFILDRIAEKESTENLFSSGSTEDDDIDIKQVNKPLHVYIDGPFGAPTSQIFHAQHAILIGTGIGVTPFASILKSIMHRYWAARNTCPKCDYRWTNDLSSSVMNLRKVDFFWINREQRSFEWFVSLLSQLEIEQAEQGGAMERFLDMHMYITSALQKTDMKAVGLQLALELLHEKSKRDLITGLKTRTIAGRPNWDKVFKQVSENRKGRVTVFFCGPPQLGKILKLKCDQWGFDYRKENF